MLIILVVILGFLSSLITAMRDQSVQNFVARTTAGFLSDKMDIEIQIGSFFFDHLLNLYLKKIKVYDKKDSLLLAADEITVDIALTNVLKELHVQSVILQNVYFNLVKYDSEENLNLQFLIDFFTSGQKKQKEVPLLYPITLDDLEIENGNFRYWNQNKDQSDAEGMDYAHLNIRNINLLLKDFRMLGDSMSANIIRLSANDTCGIVLERFNAPKLFVSSKGISAENMVIVTTRSSVRLDLEMKHNTWSAYTNFVDSVYLKASIDPSSLYMADIGYFSPVLFSMTDLLSLSGDVEGYVNDFQAKNFTFSFGDKTEFHGDVAMAGLPDFFSTHIDLKINRMNLLVTDLKQFAVPVESRYLPIPKQLEAIGMALVRGSFNGTYSDFLTKLKVETEIGDLKTDLLMRRDTVADEMMYNGILTTSQLHLGKLIGMKNEIGKIDMDFAVDGKGLEKGMIDVIADGTIHSIELLGNTFNDIVLAGKASEQQFNGSLKVDDEKLRFDFLGKIDFSRSIPDMDFCLDIAQADLCNLNLLSNDSVMNLKSKLSVNLKGIKLNDMEGSLQIDSTLYADSKGTYFMKQLKMDIQKDAFMSRKASIRSDFFDFDLGGIIDFNSFISVFNSYLAHYVRIPGLIPENNTEANHDFFVSLILHHPNELTRLLMPALHIADTTRFDGAFTSKDKVLETTFRSNEISYSGIRFENLILRTKSDLKEAMASIYMRNIVLRDSTETDTIYIALANPMLMLSLRNDSIMMQSVWGERTKMPRTRGNLKAAFVPDSAYGGRFNFYSADILVNDSVWSITPDNVVVFGKEQTEIKNLTLHQGKQYLKIDGALPYYDQDTISVAFENWKLSNFDVFLRGMGLNLEGEINGDLQLANMKQDPTFFSNLYIKTLTLNKEPIGNAKIVSSWNNDNESIYLNTQFINIGDAGSSRTLNLTGFYYPTRKGDNINCELQLDNFRLKPISPFLKGILSRVEGIASAKLNITGSFDKPQLTGRMDLYRAGFRIDYLNTFYSLQHGFDFTKDKIIIDNLVLYDTIGNTATVNGTVTHNYLKDFAFNIGIEPNRFLALNTTRQMNNLFYGTAVASGKVSVTGALNNINLAIDMQTNEGTEAFIPLNNTSTVSDKDFIIFMNPNTLQDTAFLLQHQQVKPSMNFSMNISANIDPNASVMIFLPANMGSLGARGAGNLRMGVRSTGDFTLLGDYIIQDGEFNFAFENLVRRRFDLMSGGKISWTGDPVDATIDVSGRYRLKTSLGSLGITADSTSSMRNRVNVDCIIHLRNQLMNPDISFSIRMPQLDDDTRQQVYAILDTTNQSMMTQQMISLLVLGSFSYVGGANTNVSSSYFNVITNQLSGWLSQISKDFDIGLHYKPGDELMNEEIEVALSTQLFNDRLTIEGNFGMINDRNATAQNASSIVGDVDILFKITRDGRLRAMAFNHSNITSYYNFAFDNYSPYTQGVGLSYRQDFDRFKELFQRKNKKKTP